MFYIGLFILSLYRIKSKEIMIYYVYLIRREKRIVILGTKVFDENYHLLMNTSNVNATLAMNAAKLFCLGFIIGNQIGNEGELLVINNLTEFQ